MRIQEEESIFHQAIAIKQLHDRNEFLQQFFPSDPSARQRVQQRVAEHFGPRKKILDETTVCLLSNQTARLPEIGSKIGPYKLLQEIGEGGMGLVFMAEQTAPVKRKVALKVIKIGMDTRRVVARFESERQAMALMDHPCITKVLDAGATDAGRPYFVMELVRGHSITNYCDDRRLSPRQRLQIFAKVCHALEHAHQKGIIHRDIKPSNIMVTNHDGIPAPKIIDFGIAKAVDDSLTDKTLFTNYGEMIGTPMYMSPEQAEMSALDVDTRSDIYSLGVVLYELLTGTTPFHEMKHKSLNDIREAIRSQAPQLASTRVNDLGETVYQVTSNRDTDVRSLQRFIRGELDWILMKCLARDRAERYQSAGELAREIQRYLDGQNVEAAAPTLQYRTRKFVAKHRTSVAFATCFAVLLLGATLFSTLMALKANRAEQLANSRLQDVVKERDRALIAEQQLAELERKQRNRVAIHKAASKHNTDMVKRYLTHWPAPTGQATSLKSINNPPLFKIKSMGAHFRPTDQGRKIFTSDSEYTQTAAFVDEGSKCTSNNWSFCDDVEARNIELIMLTENEQHEEELLKSILHNQKAAFGCSDIVVVQTLNQLGELMSNKQQWRRSQAYFREALDIVQKEADQNPDFAAVRVKLVNALKNQGDVQRAVTEFQEFKDAVSDIDVPKGVANWAKQLNINFRQKTNVPAEGS